MKRVWKFELSPTTELTLPSGSIPLCVQMQRGEPQVWIEISSEKSKDILKFIAYGTGHDMPENAGTYLGTFQRGSLVFHVYFSRALSNDGKKS